MTTPTPENGPDRQVEQALHDLAVHLETPPVDPAGDVHRGRRRLLRDRVAIGGAALAVLAVAGIVAVSVPGGTNRSIPVATGSTAPPSVASAEPTASTATDPNTVTPTSSGQEQTGRVTRTEALAARQDTLRDWQRTLAQHLDPDFDHLDRSPRGGYNEQTSAGRTGLSALGSRYDWRNAGDPGLGMLVIEVSRGGRATLEGCDADPCREFHRDGVEVGRVSSHDGAIDVVVKRDDGQVVRLTADPLFGNNSLIALQDFGVSEDAMIDAASDPGLRLGDLPDIPPDIEQAVTDSVALLGGNDGYSYSQHTSRGEDGRDDLAVYLTIGDSTRQVQLVALARKDGDPEWSCGERFARCEDREYDGREAQVGYRDPTDDTAGWTVAYDGPTYEIRVEFTGPASELAVADALRFATAPELQVLD